MTRYHGCFSCNSLYNETEKDYCFGCGEQLQPLLTADEIVTPTAADMDYLQEKWEKLFPRFGPGGSDDKNPA